MYGDWRAEIKSVYAYKLSAAMEKEGRLGLT